MACTLNGFDWHATGSITAQVVLGINGVATQHCFAERQRTPKNHIISNHFIPGIYNLTLVNTFAAMNAWESDIVPCTQCVNCNFRAERNKDRVSYNTVY